MSNLGKVRIDLCKRMSIVVECFVDEDGMPIDEQECDKAIERASFEANRYCGAWELDSENAINPEQ